MATSYSTLLGLALPVQGELSGTWGDTVNNYITNYLDSAVAGALTLSTDANVTLTKTTGTALGTTSSQYAILNCTGARTVQRTITAPAASKIYVINNATTGGFGVKIVGAGPTTGVVVPAGTRMLVAWNGSDFVTVAESQITLTSDVTGTLPVANGGTGVATLTGVAYGNGTSAFTAATGAQIATAIGTNAVTNATNLNGSGTISSTTTGTTQTAGTNNTTIATTAFVQSAITTATPTQVQPISASVAGNALTISASALSLDFRSTTLGSGTVTRVSGTPSNLVISSGSTLGTTNGVASNIVVLAINNAGTIELAAVNLTGGNQLAETNLISTTAEGGAGAADSASVIYSTTARTNVAYRVIGQITSTQTTAGTWATAPSLIQGAGGNALTSMASLGYGQTWQSATIVSGTTYYNTTGKPIVFSAYVSNTVGNAYIYVQINGGSAMYICFDSLRSGDARDAGEIVVPSGASYAFTITGTATFFVLR